MKVVALFLVILVWGAGAVRGQTGQQALHDYRATLRRIKLIGYTIQRIDSFGTEDVWNHLGSGVLQPDPASNLLGARFFVSQRNAARSYFHNGHTGYALDDQALTFDSTRAPFALGVLGSPEGQMVVEELLTIDSTYQRVEYQLSPQGPQLTLYYPNQTNYDILHHTICLTLDSATGLPRAVKTVMHRGGTKWTTLKLLSNVRLNQAADQALLAQPPFLSTYTYAVPPAPVAPPTLVGRAAPPFRLPSITRQSVDLATYLGQVVVLDFWATWCSPCIAAMPKVQALQSRYKKQGVTVLGILVDASNNATRAQGILDRQRVNYINLLDNNKVKKLYQVSFFPRYVVIDKKGMVTFDGAADASQLEQAIQAALR
ncbi:TlpA family protein disulfide reductase [Hymenobacter bucti]|uniref:TlpA family protein disulfide reductase n=1 Tax=Hymenobacter bucti TaxID=1844114 RepID=A0ABW4QZ13_9BACT